MNTSGRRKLSDVARAACACLAMTSLASVVQAGPADALPAACTVTIVAERSVLTLGVDRETRLDVTVQCDGASGAQPGRAQATVGTIDPLVPGTVPGTFTSVYHVPGERFPQAALIAVEVALPSGAEAHATTTISLPATTTFPVHTEPRASVTIDVAGRSFGPVAADAMGAVAIPIVVPPGVDTGRAIAQGRFGGIKEMQVSLQSSDYPRLLILAPSDTDAGAPVPVEVWAIDRAGSRVDPEDIDLRASIGNVRRLGGAPGVARFVATMPRNAASGAAKLTASMSDGTSERTETLALHPGAAARLLITCNLPQLVVGSGDRAELHIAARDRWDNDTSVTGVAVVVDDLPLPIEGDAALATTTLSAPTYWSGKEKATIVARLGDAAARREILITGGPPSTLKVTASDDHLAADGRAAIDLIAEVFDRRGTPTTTARIMWSTLDDGLLVAMPSPRFGTYAARFVPNPAFRDRRAVIETLVEPDLRTSVLISVEPATARSATARVGLISNFSGLFGQSALLEGAVPYPRRAGLGRLFSVGLSLGYIHGEVTPTGPAPFSSLQTELDQIPLLGLVRMHIPARWPFELSATGLAGVTWLSSEITDLSTGAVISRGSAAGVVAGLGGDMAFPLLPGEFVVGVRYLAIAVDRLSNGDKLSGNAGGLMADLGFRLRL